MAHTKLRYVDALACTIVLPWTVFPTSASMYQPRDRFDVSELTVIDEPQVSDHKKVLLVPRVRP